MQTMKEKIELPLFTDDVFSIISKAVINDKHHHQLAQLSVPKNGILYLMIYDKVYILPSHMAIFIPPNAPHGIYKPNPNTIIENIYFQEDNYPLLPKEIKTFHLSDLAKSVIARLCQVPKKNLAEKKTKNLVTVLLDELSDSENQLEYKVAIPCEEGLLKIFNYMMDVVDYLPSLADCAKLINVSPRTLQRKLRDEFNTHFILWRQHIMFIKSLALLYKYKKTSIASYKLGYNSESAFITMFKKMSGQRLPSEF